MKLLRKVIIKPSSSTPKPLRKHLLSSIDQAMFPTYNPLVYYFRPSNSIIPNSDKSKRLKKSLSEVLSRFYPLAGTLVGNHYVDCNDAGVPFLEAETSCDLTHVVPNRNHEFMEKLLPHSEVAGDSHDLCLAVQTTYFRCGGLALGILVSHKVADALSTFMFANAWAATAASGGGARLLPPKFDAAAYFPPLHQETSGVSEVVKKEELATRIITFPAAAISLLRERYSGGGLRPSRVEALSAFIWTRFMSATGARSDPSKAYVVRHPMNIRRRVDPPLSDNHFGNIVSVSRAVLAAEDGGVEVVRRIRDSVGSGVVGSTDVGEKEFVFFTFSSICGYPIYEADFGWGRPVWVGLGRFPFKNVVFFVDEQSGGGGIEAFIQLTKQDMLKFEARLELHMPLIKSKF